MVIYGRRMELLSAFNIMFFYVWLGASLKVRLNVNDCVVDRVTNVSVFKNEK